MLRIALVYPGTTDYDVEGRIQGNLDIPLNAVGHEEVARLAEELKAVAAQMDTVYAGQCEPAWETAQVLAHALDLKLKKVEQLENLNHGLWQGMLVEEVRHKQPKVYRQWQEQPGTVCPPEGEMVGSAEERMRAALTKILKRHKEGIVGIVVSEPMASLVRCCIKQEELGDLWKGSAERGRFEILEVDPEKLLSAVNG